MKMFLVLASDDAESSRGLFDNQEAAQFVCDNEPEDFDLMVKEYECNEKPEDGNYYFVVNEDDYVMVDDCFASKEKALKYVEENDLSDYEIHGFKMNTIYDGGNTSVDDNGEPIKPADDDMCCSLYNAYQKMKENNIDVKWYESPRF